MQIIYICTRIKVAILIFKTALKGNQVENGDFRMEISDCIRFEIQI